MESSEQRAEPPARGDSPPLETAHEWRPHPAPRPSPTPRPSPAPRPMDASSKASIRAALFRPHAPPRLGRFELRGKLGQGGMGTVLHAYDQTLDREVALKLLHRDLQDQHGPRLLREAQALARLSHPNVVTVYEVGTVDDQTFIAMELVHGQTLAQWQQKPHTWRECVEVYRQAGQGLAAAHEQGLVHRDFKPANCIIDEAGRVRVLDFGLARRHDMSTNTAPVSAAEDAAARSPPTRPRSDRSRTSLLNAELTHAGSVMGTLAYMAPEQRRGEVVDALSDQFSFCVSLYEAIHGRRPGTSPKPSTSDSSAPAGTPPARPPRWLMRALERGLAPAPRDRWPSMHALLHELERASPPRGGRRLLLALTGAVTLTGLGIWLRPIDGATACDDGPQQLAGIWDDTQREAVAVAIMGTELSYAASTESKVRQQLDAYAQTWLEVYAEICEATESRSPTAIPSLDPRRRCLRLRRAALEDGVNLLATADEAVVEHAVELTVGLPSVQACRDVDALARAAGPSREPELERAVEALEAQMGEARALHRAGQPEPGLRALTPVLAEVDALGDPRLQARALQLRGELHHGAGHPEHAEEDLQTAYLGALEHDDPQLALETLSSLIYVVGVERAQGSAGRWLGATARALAARHEPEGILLAQCLTAEGQVYFEQGQYPTAQRRYEHALEILERRRGPQHLDLAAPLDGLAHVVHKQGEQASAQQYYERALAIRMEQLGPEHPAVAHLRINLGAVLDEQGQHAAAQAHYEDALAILERTRAPDHPQLAHALANLGAGLAQQGKVAQAEPRLRRAIEIWERSHGPHHPRVAKAKVSLGVVLKKLGSLDEALEHYHQALDALRTDSSETQADHGEAMAHVQVNIGVVLTNKGRLEEAEAHYREALAIFTRTVGKDSAPVARVLDKLGGLSLRRGDYAEAAGHHQRALAIARAEYGPEHRQVAITLWALGRARARLGEWNLARDALERARAMLMRVDPSPRMLVKAELTLAEVHWALGEHAAAIAVARAARGRLAGVEVDKDKDPLAREIGEWIEGHAVR